LGLISFKACLQGVQKIRRDLRPVASASPDRTYLGLVLLLVLVVV
jgi:hypothetical protein